MASSQDTEPFHWHFSDLDGRSFEIRGRTLFFIVVLFSIITLFTLIFFYARWICRYHHPLPHAPPPRPPPQPQPQPLGLDPSTIKSLPIILHRSNSVSEEKPECCICLACLKMAIRLRFCRCVSIGIIQSALIGGSVATRVAHCAELHSELILRLTQSFRQL